jgi:hypothetical protein
MMRKIPSTKGKRKVKRFHLGRIPLPQKSTKIMPPKKGKGSYRRKGRVEDDSAD